MDVHDWSKLNLPHDWSIYFDFDHKSPARNEGGQLMVEQLGIVRLSH